jgi:predicted GNAT family N-acyltransferase
MDYRVEVASSVEDLLKAFAIRAAVYMAEQNCPYKEEFDQNDFCGMHLICYANDEPAATLRLRFFASFAKVERVAVLKRFRGEEISKVMILRVVDVIRRKGYRTIYGHVQERLVPMWQKWGFKLVPQGRQFFFSDHRYVEMYGDLEPDPKAITLETDPLVMLRPEGQWDEPGVLEASTERPYTNPT